MDALILAAGRGSRMGQLTEVLPKPLLQAGDQTLIEHQIERLKCSGIHDIVINLAWLGDLIEQRLGDGSDRGVNLRYSREPEGALETAGGIAHALPLVRSDPFLVVNADVWIDRRFDDLGGKLLDTGADANLSNSKDACLLLTDNPDFHPDGDFFLGTDNRVRYELEATDKDLHKLTYTGIAVFKKKLFENLPKKIYPLRPVLVDAIRNNGVVGEYFHGRWLSVDTPERLDIVSRWSNDQRSEDTKASGFVDGMSDE